MAKASPQLRCPDRFVLVADLFNIGLALMTAHTLSGANDATPGVVAASRHSEAQTRADAVCVLLRAFRRDCTATVSEKHRSKCTVPVLWPYLST